MFGYANYIQVEQIVQCPLTSTSRTVIAGGSQKWTLGKVPGITWVVEKIKEQYSNEYHSQNYHSKYFPIVRNHLRS
ncbi:MAG: hypothetical protein R3306_11990, partial [Arenibacter algicola]|nr:hypothetical protein [Arenibacter algicola]